MRHLANISILFFLMVGLNYADLDVVSTHLPPMQLAAIGFIILAAFATGQLFKEFKFPALLGYIVAGIVFGPELTEVLPAVDEALFSRQVIDDLSLINVLTIGVIGTLGGGELRLSDLKNNYSIVLSIIVLFFVSVVPLTFGVCYGLIEFFPGLVPFLSDVPTSTQIVACLLFGVLGFAMSPAATLAIIQETKAKGRFTSTVLGVVIVADLVLVASFVFAMAFGDLLIGSGQLEMSALLAELPTIGKEFFWALIVGIGAGLTLILYLRFVGQEMLLFTVAVIFAGTYIAKLLHAETLLAFLTAGFIVQNFSEQGEDMIHAIERISLPVFVVYFMIQAAQLDLIAFQTYFPLAIILTVVRTATLFGGSKLAIEMFPGNTGADDKLWMSFVSRGGVDIVLASIVANRMGAWGADFQAVVMALVLIHIIAGPILLKYSLRSAGEVDGEEAETPEESTTDLPSDANSMPEIGFEFPDISDPKLQKRIEFIQQEVLECHQECVVQPVEERRKQIRESLESIDDIIANTFAELREIKQKRQDLASEELSEEIRMIHVDYHQRLEPHIERLSELNPMAITPKTAENIIDRLQGIVHFETEYNTGWRASEVDRIQRESGLGTRLLRKIRQVGNSMMGGQSRTIPLGQLWRYYVELSVPTLLADSTDALSEENEKFWYELSSHLRRVDNTFEYLLEKLEEETDDHDRDNATRVPVTLLELSIDPEPSSTDTNKGDGESTPRNRSIEDEIEYAISNLEEHQQELIEYIERFSNRALQTFTYSISSAYREFLDGLLKAGTIELPAFRYRPSRRFDQARKARERLQKRLEREEIIVVSHQGWLTIEHEMTLFLHWFYDFKKRVHKAYTRVFRQESLKKLESLKETCDAAPVKDDQSNEWREWFINEVRPKLEETEETLQRATNQLADGIISRQLIDQLKIRVSQLPIQAKILLNTPRGPSESTDRQFEVPIRKWYRRSLVREMALEFIEIDEQLERALNRSLIVLEDLEQVLGDDQPISSQAKESIPPLSQSDTSSDRVDYIHRMVEEAVELLQLDDKQIHDDIDKGTTDILREANSPFRDGNFEPIFEATKDRENILTKTDASKTFQTGLQESWQKIKLEWKRFNDAIGVGLEGPLGQRQFLDEYKIRDYLDLEFGSKTKDVPPIYRRLFSLTPLNISDFYISRPELESSCIEAIEYWARNNSGSLLLSGDTGVGKRMFSHRIIPLHLEEMDSELATDCVHTISLNHHPYTERQIARTLATVSDSSGLSNFDEVADAFEGLSSRQVIILENADKIFTRTESGLERIKRFTSLINRTSSSIFWVILLSRAQAGLLQTLIGFKDSFEYILELSPLHRDQLEGLILARHQASGYQLEFEQPDLTAFDYLFDPIKSVNKKNHPKQLFFRRLERLCFGNPELALLIWLRAAKISETRDKTITIEPLARNRPNYTASLTVKQRVILATLIQHRSLTQNQLVQIIQEPDDILSPDLNRLRKLGFIEQLSGTRSWRLTNMAEPIVTRELRQREML